MTVTVTLTGIQLQKEISVCRGESATLTATLVPSDATADITWESSDETIVTVSKGELTGVAVGTATVTAKAGSVKAECAVTILPPKGAVDMGMELTREDGTTYKLYWAECNLGAEKPEDYGDYYAWGEVEPSYSSQDPLTWKDGKTGYDWASYKWCNSNYEKLTKYCTADETSYWDGEGSPDGKTVLDPEDDAARVNLGGTWRMPTDAEWTELRTECTWTWTTQNGVNGRLVTGKNGNSIFLPAAGNLLSTGLFDAGSYGDYWSFSLDPDEPAIALNVYFYSDDVCGSTGTRTNGYSIRPVTE
ncbi:MAG: Ig-like domain-containing protein [Bacteroidales bacterium]|nr:Ig-like domain-containing protein [Bacteroidales bacterium]